MALPVFIDTDLAMGSGHGDVDDGFALAAMLWSGVPVLGLSSVFGNTDVGTVTRCCRDLLGLWSASPSPEVYQGARFGGELDTPAATALAHVMQPLRVLALGPLTNIAAALVEQPNLVAHLAEVVVLGGCLHKSGHFPPIFPFEFNLTKDRWATKFLWRTSIPLTFLPLDIVKGLHLRPLRRPRSPLGVALNREAGRWLRRSQRLGRGRVPVWDLAAAMYALYPALFEVEEIGASLSPLCRTWMGEGRRPIRVVTGFDQAVVWRRFEQLAEEREFSGG